jgi:hypothetical protein
VLERRKTNIKVDIQVCFVGLYKGFFSSLILSPLYWLLFGDFHSTKEIKIDIKFYYGNLLFYKLCVYFCNDGLLKNAHGALTQVNNQKVGL